MFSHDDLGDGQAVPHRADPCRRAVPPGGAVQVHPSASRRTRRLSAVCDRCRLAPCAGGSHQPAHAAAKATPAAVAPLVVTSVTCPERNGAPHEHPSLRRPWSPPPLSCSPPQPASAAPAQVFSGDLVDLSGTTADTFGDASAHLVMVQTGIGTMFHLRVKGIDRAAAGTEYGADLHIGPCVEGNGAAALGHYNASPTTPPGGEQPDGGVAGLRGHRRRHRSRRRT